MSLFKENLKPSDCVAIIVLIAGFFLIYLGKDGVVGGLLTVVVAFYFGEKAIQDRIEKKSSIETVEDIIRRIAGVEGVDPDLAVRVATCESSLNPSAKNVNTDGSVDRGVFQWNNKWHPEISDVCAFDVECAAREFCKAFKGGNLSWWDATKKCWDK